MEKQTNATKNHNFTTSMATAGDLPPELDFFKYAQNVTGKRKGTVQTEDNQARQRRRRVEDIEHEESQTEQELPNPVPTVHRVKTKGINIPTSIGSFEELKKYSIPAHLYPNLASGGYKSPTGVQSHCIPILLEVSAVIMLLFI
jgi:ATP-dependent RNA helicase DDX52/ROK1